MSQSRKRSSLEAGVNILIGYVLSNIIWFVLAWYEETGFTLLKNIKIVSIFTFFSFLRSYGLRRVFNRFDNKGE